MYMNKYFLTFLFSLTCVFAMSAETAASVLKKASDKLNASKGTTAVFVIADSNSGTSKGSISIAGSKFALTTSFNTIIFNGKTQWTIDKSAKEVSIYTPTSDEVAQMNPLSIIRSATSAYSSKLLKSAAGTHKVQLTPKAKGSALKYITITFSASTSLPTVINMQSADGSNAQISISDLKLNVNIPASKFTVSQSAYPGYDFVDLR